jgi:hypothetical protein
MGKELVAYVKEHGDHIYIQAPVTLYEPGEQEIAALTYGQQVTAAASMQTLKERAPNPKILWLQGRYVEADNANRNGDQWTAGDLAVKSLTPVFMPITVMHDFRTAVGTIADTTLKLPNDHPDVPRARIETALAVWKHRFPDIADEAVVNAQQGTLMQSMECISPAYDCSVCGQVYARLPKQAEREHWCAHLRGEATAEDGRAAARILRNVTFTGTGLIFGTRGARGAYPEAYLEVEALAELHARAHSEKAAAKSQRSTRRKNVMEIEDARYAELIAAEEKAKRLPDAEQRASEAEQKAEREEAARIKAEGERDEEKKRADKAEETANQAKLRDERLGKFGSAFTAKLDKTETIKARLHKQAATMSDDEWSERVAEVEEALAVKHDAKLDGNNGGGDGNNGDGGNGDENTAGDDLFDKEVVARAGVGVGNGGGGGTATAPTVQSRQSVIGGLARPKAPAKA